MVAAHEHDLVDRIALVPAPVSPDQTGDSLAPANSLMRYFTR